MKILELAVTFVGHIAWPIVALIIGLKLVSELKSGLLAKIVRPGGTIEYAGVKLRVSEDTEQARHSVEALGIKLETPNYAEPVDAGPYDPKIDDLPPYEVVMTAWSDLAEIITQIAVRYKGYDDRRQVWANAEILRKKKVIDANTLEAVRDVQSARNSIRRTGEVDRDTARSYARSAYSLKKAFEAIQADAHSTQSSPMSR